jgi:hypothetical protein
LQFKPAKQLRVCRDYDRGQAHRNRADAHGEIESPMDENTCRDWDRYKVIGKMKARPDEKSLWSQ